MENTMPETAEERDLMVVPYKDNNYRLPFVYPSFGPETYSKVGKEILANQFLSQKLQVPIGDETAYLLHAVYCSNLKYEPFFFNARGIIANSILWVYNQDLFTDKGIFVVPDYKANGMNQRLNANELEKEILKENGATELSNGVRFSKNKEVRFAPKGSYTLHHYGSSPEFHVSPGKFAKDGFIIASCGEQGAEKLAEVSASFRNNPYIFGLNVKEGDLPKQGVSAVHVLEGRLRFGGGWDGAGGHVFSLCCLR